MTTNQKVDIKTVLINWFRTNQPKHYVIGVMANDETEPEFFAVDRTSGGHPYWTASPSSAEIFTSSEAAIARLEMELNVKRANYTDGSSAPNSVVHSGLKLCNTKKFAHGIFFVAPYQVLENCYERIVHDRLRSPKDAIDWRDLFVMQARSNDNKGIPYVRDICTHLENNDFEKAIACIQQNWDFIKHHENIVNWLTDAELIQ